MPLYDVAKFLLRNCYLTKVLFFCRKKRHRKRTNMRAGIQIKSLMSMSNLHSILEKISLSFTPALVRRPIHTGPDPSWSSCGWRVHWEEVLWPSTLGDDRKNEITDTSH